MGIADSGVKKTERHFSVMASDRTRGNGHKQKHKIFCFIISKTFFYYGGGQTHRTECSECLQSLHPWRYSNPNWTQSAVAYPTLNRAWDWLISRGAFPPQVSCDETSDLAAFSFLQIQYWISDIYLLSCPSARVALCPLRRCYASFNKAQVPTKHRFRKIPCIRSSW